MPTRQKNILTTMLGVYLFFLPNGFCAENLRLFVMPVDGKTEDLKKISKEATSVFIEQIKRKTDYTYISPEKLCENWFGDWVKEEEEEDEEVVFLSAKNLVKGTKERIADSSFKAMFGHDILGVMAEYKKFWGVDLVIVSEISKKDKLLHIYSEIIDMNTGRFYSVNTNARPRKLKFVIKSQVKDLLGKVNEIQKVEAADEISSLRSIVSYFIKTLGEELIQIKADYTSVRPNPELQTINFILPQNIKEGEKVYKVQAKGNKIIEFKGFYKDGQLEKIKMYTTPPSESGDIEREEKLSVLSQENHIINFIFLWKGKTLKEVKVSPLVNPYCAVK